MFIKVLKLTRNRFSECMLKEKEIPNTLEGIQKEVDGYIETMFAEISGNRYVFVFNETGKLQDLNETLAIVHNNNLVDTIVGNIIITKADDVGDFVSLEDYDIQKIQYYFKTIPHCVNSKYDILPCYVI